MKLFESSSKHVSIFNLALVAIATLLLPILEAKAQDKLARQTELTNSSTNFPSLPTQDKVCPSSKLLPKRSFETDKYLVYICRGEKAGSLGYYVRVSKTEVGKTTIPVTQANGETYVAIKEELAHAINPHELIVIKRGRLIQG
jgi:ribosomal protein S4E